MIIYNGSIDNRQSVILDKAKSSKNYSKCHISPETDSGIVFKKSAKTSGKVREEGRGEFRQKNKNVTYNIP